MNATIPSDVIHVGQIEIRFRLEAAQTGGHFTMFEYLIPVNARVPVAHSHEALDETTYGLDGATTVTLDGHKVIVERGDVLLIPRGSVHQVENLAAIDARGLCVVTPGLLARSTSARSPTSSTLEDRRMSNESRPSCDATAFARFSQQPKPRPLSLGDSNDSDAARGNEEQAVSIAAQQLGCLPVITLLC